MYLLPIFILLTFCTPTIVSDPDVPTTCSTPTGEQGICIPLRSCPELKQVYCNGSESDQIQIEALACNSSIAFTVCCVATKITTKATTEVPKAVTTAKLPEITKKPRVVTITKTNRKLLPNKRYCGMQHSDDYNDFNYEGNEAAIDEFPWMVEIECVYKFQRAVTRFPGVLLNTRYVLSTDKCFGDGKTIVTFGKYKENKEGVSCILTKFREKYCTDPEQKLTAIESFQYPDGGFTLLRLEKRISYSDYIRPICLPFASKDKPKLHTKIASSGWSINPAHVAQYDAKKKIVYEVITNDQCKENDTVPSDWERICSKRVTDQDFVACKGDKGSPVMFKNKHNWYLVGTLGDPQCHSKMPVTTNLVNADVMNWILNTIRA